MIRFSNPAGHEAQGNVARLQFDRICTNDLQLLSLEATAFHTAAKLTTDSETGLHAGDALHLACAMHARAQWMVTLEVVIAKDVRRLKLKPVPIDKAKHSPCQDRHFGLGCAAPQPA